MSLRNIFTELNFLKIIRENLHYIRSRKVGESQKVSSWDTVGPRSVVQVYKLSCYTKMERKTC